MIQLQVCFCLLGLAPVSYTHLDVYKRQGVEIKDGKDGTTWTRV